MSFKFGQSSWFKYREILRYPAKTRGIGADTGGENSSISLGIGFGNNAKNSKLKTLEIYFGDALQKSKGQRAETAADPGTRRRRRRGAISTAAR